MIPNYHPPADYRRPTKTQEKVYVPVNDYPEINFSMITNLLTFSFLVDTVMHAISCKERGVPLTLSPCFSLSFY